MKRNELSISPSVLASDFSRAAEALTCISDSGCNYVHLDVMDGQFVPDITFGPKFIKDLKKNSVLLPSRSPKRQDAASQNARLPGGVCA